HLVVRCSLYLCSLPTSSPVYCLFDLHRPPYVFRYCFFIATASTEIYTLSLHDALPICSRSRRPGAGQVTQFPQFGGHLGQGRQRSEEHTSELQSRENLVCRLLLEKKKTIGQI